MHCALTFPTSSSAAAPPPPPLSTASPSCEVKLWGRDGKNLKQADDHDPPEQLLK